MKHARPRLFRWWMIPLCLVTSWLCWWGVDKWLEPKPLWSSTLPGGLAYYPLVKEAKGTRIVAQVMKTSARKGFPQLPTQTLVVLDAQTGQELHRVEMQRQSSFSDGEEEFTPRIHRDVVWYLARDSSNSSLTFRLCSWDLKTGVLDEHVQSWKQPPYNVHISWPPESPILVVRNAMPRQLLRIGFWSGLFHSLIFERMYSSALVSVPMWFESYELTQSGQQPRLLARWAPPASHWFSGIQLSSDGRWAAFPEPWGDARLAYQRAKASGRSTFQGEELFELFRSQEKGLVVYDTSTGKRVYQNGGSTAYMSTSGWHKDYLAAVSFRPSTEKSLTLEELRLGAEDVNMNLFSRTFPQEHHVLRWKANTFSEITKPASLDGAYLHFYHGHLYGNQRQYPNRTYYELKPQGEQLVIQRQITSPWDHGFYWWIPDSNQYLDSSPSFVARMRAKWQGKSAWLNSLLTFALNLFGEKPLSTIVEQGPHETRQYTFPRSGSQFITPDRSQFWLLQMDKADEQIVSITLITYALPLSISSPWWSRGAACVPVAVLVACIVMGSRWRSCRPSGDSSLT